jgi:hypothetical protein
MQAKSELERAAKEVKIVHIGLRAADTSRCYFTVEFGLVMKSGHGAHHLEWLGLRFRLDHGLPYIIR